MNICQKANMNLDNTDLNNSSNINNFNKKRIKINGYYLKDYIYIRQGKIFIHRGNLYKDDSLICNFDTSINKYDVCSKDNIEQIENIYKAANAYDKTDIPLYHIKLFINLLGNIYDIHSKLIEHISSNDKPIITLVSVKRHTNKIAYSSIEAFGFKDIHNVSKQNVLNILNDNNMKLVQYLFNMRVKDEPEQNIKLKI